MHTIIIQQIKENIAIYQNHKEAEGILTRWI